MGTFEEIRKKIAIDIENNKSQLPTPVAGKTTLPVDDNGLPNLASRTVIGTIVSRPGSEKVVLDASTFQFMECITSAVGLNKVRYCVVEKGTRATYGNQFINSCGERTHILTREVYTLFLGVINNVSKQLHTLSTDKAHAEEQRDMYKLTIDALRKNGIID